MKGRRNKTGFYSAVLSGLLMPQDPLQQAVSFDLSGGNAENDIHEFLLCVNKLDPV